MFSFLPSDKVQRMIHSNIERMLAFLIGSALRKSWCTLRFSAFGLPYVVMLLRSPRDHFLGPFFAMGEGHYY